MHGLHLTADLHECQCDTAWLLDADRLGAACRSATLAADWKLDPRWTTGLSYTYRSGGPLRITATRGNLETYRRELDLYVLWTPSKRNKLRLALRRAWRRGAGAQP